MLKRLYKAVLFRLGKFVAITFFLLASEQVFAHANHSFFDEQSSNYSQSFFDEATITETNSVKDAIHKTMVNANQATMVDIQQAQNHSFNLALKNKIVFQNHLLVQQLRIKKTTQVKSKISQEEEECNCLNDCSCLECQCADCPMSVSCSAVSMVLSNSNITTVQPIHEYLVLSTINYFISQPHTLPFRPPIAA